MQRPCKHFFPTASDLPLQHPSGPLSTICAPVSALGDSQPVIFPSQLHLLRFLPWSQVFLRFLCCLFAEHVLVLADLGTAYPHFVQGSVQRFLPQKSCFLISLLKLAFLSVFILSLISFFFSALSNRSELHVPPLECQR